MDIRKTSFNKKFTVKVLNAVRKAQRIGYSVVLNRKGKVSIVVIKWKVSILFSDKVRYMFLDKDWNFIPRDYLPECKIFDRAYTVRPTCQETPKCVNMKSTE